MDKPKKIIYHAFMNGEIVRAIELLGGEKSAAACLGSTRQAVWYWLRGERNVSPKFVLKIEAETNDPNLEIMLYLAPCIGI